jgi:hypothetical protein
MIAVVLLSNAQMTFASVNLLEKVFFVAVSLDLRQEYTGKQENSAKNRKRSLSAW